MSIARNLENVRERIAKAAIRSGRKPEDIVLIAVTKTHAPDKMNEAISAGAADIGENKPQEVRDKFSDVLEARWHLIGHLQTNKVKYIIDKCTMIHSVDSIKLMYEIERQAILKDVNIDILIQVNIAKEESKSGIDAGELTGLLEYAQGLERVKVKGLMTIIPIGDEDENRIHFMNMKKLFDETAAKEFKNVTMEYLSMGMSGDFETAIECGSNMVRVGSAIFGARDYGNI